MRVGASLVHDGPCRLATVGGMGTIFDEVQMWGEAGRGTIAVVGEHTSQTVS